MNYTSKTIDEVELDNRDLVHSILVLDSMESSKSSRTNGTCAQQEAIMLNEDSKRIHPDLLNRRRNALANIWSFELVRY